MAVAEEKHIDAEPLVPLAIKEFLQGFSFGRWGICAGRSVIRAQRKLRDPAQYKTWMGRFLMPVRNILLANRPLHVTFNQISVALAPRGAVAAAIWTGLRCESREVSFIFDMLKPGMTVFDVGANAGIFAISAAKKIGGGRVFAFEPRPSTCELLNENLQLNHVPDVHVVKMVLGDTVGKGVLQVNASGNDGRNTLGQATHPHSPVVGQEDVGVTTVDVFVKKRNVSRIDVMKVDIEGAELMLFRGARELLSRADAPLILYGGFGFLTRGFGYHPVEILWLLKSCGYSLFTLNSETGAIAALTSDYNYDTMIVAVKPENALFSDWRASHP